VQGSTYSKSLPPVSAAITTMVFLAGRVWTATADGKAQIWDARVRPPSSRLFVSSPVCR
jgi:hypothetical protein